MSLFKEMLKIESGPFPTYTERTAEYYYVLKYWVCSLSIWVRTQCVFVYLL